MSSIALRRVSTGGCCLPLGSSMHLPPSNRRRITVAGAEGDVGGEITSRSEAGEVGGVLFAPFEEASGQLRLLDEILDSAPLPGPTTMAPCSLARLDYDERLEAAVNEQINTEYSLSYVYHALAAFMDRDNVGLPGFAAYFNASSADERHHAGRLMAQQNRRGGRVKLKTLLAPESEYASETRGEALWSLELGLALEKLNFAKLRELHAVASSVDDAEMEQFVEAMLQEQAADVQRAAELVSRARRAGPGLGVYELDRELQSRHGYGLMDMTGTAGADGAGGGNGNGADGAA